MRLYYRFCQKVLQTLFVALFRLRVFGREHVPLEGGVLLICNHQSFLDPPLCGTGLQRELDYIARDTLFRNKLFAKLIGSLNALPLQRKAADIRAMKTIIRLLKGGHAITLFPEGTRSWDGRIRLIQSGLELIVRRSGATVVPMVIDGAFECWPRHQLLPSLGSIKLMYGEPITPAEFRGMSREEFVGEINARLRFLQSTLRGRSGKKVFVYE